PSVVAKALTSMWQVNHRLRVRTLLDKTESLEVELQHIEIAPKNPLLSTQAELVAQQTELVTKQTELVAKQRELFAEMELTDVSALDFSLLPDDLRCHI